MQALLHAEETQDKQWNVRTLTRVHSQKAHCIDGLDGTLLSKHNIRITCHHVQRVLSHGLQLNSGLKT